MRHFIDIGAMSAAALEWILAEALRRKSARIGRPAAAPDDDRPLEGRALAAIFEKNSTRTRLSFDLAMRQLGGAPIILNAADLQLGRGEPIEDTARVLSHYVDAVAIRALRHESLTRFASAASIPTINGLTDHTHPCQIMADLLTLTECFGALDGLKLAWIGDFNNVARSLLEAAGILKLTLTLACPEEYGPEPRDLAKARGAGGRIEIFHDTAAAATGADAVFTDVWVSMGDSDSDRRRTVFPPFQVNENLMAIAATRAIFLHCLPAMRGEEVSAVVIDGPQSRVWQEAENRIHAQKAILLWCFGAGPA